MKTVLFAFLGLLVYGSALSQYNSKNLSIPATTDNSYTYQHLRIYPIYASKEFLEVFKDVGKYMTLSKALEEKKVVISEAVDSTRIIRSGNNLNNNAQVQQQQYQTGGETVNKLFIENVSEDTVLVFAGEVVKGGKQDRMLAQNMLLPPKSGKMDVSVFCVEQNRWTYGENNDSTKTKFTTNKNYASNSMRKVAIVDKNQSGVWKEVDNVTTKNNAKTNSNTFTALKESKEYQEKLAGYLSYFEKSIKDTINLVGFVACTGDKVIGCDMFATHDMLKNQMANLLQTYTTEAITNGSNPTVNSEMVNVYLNKFLTDESTQDVEVNKNGTIYKHKGRKLMMSKF